jgi:hypothetical protein
MLQREFKSEYLKLAGVKVLELTGSLQNDKEALKYIKAQKHNRVSPFVVLMQPEALVKLSFKSLLIHWQSVDVCCPISSLINDEAQLILLWGTDVPICLLVLVASNQDASFTQL